MKTLLINPEMSIANYIPLGLTSIAAYAQKFGFASDIFTCQGKTPPDLESKLSAESWGIIGFTGLISHYKDLKLFTKMARQTNPTSLIVLGGPLANAIPEYLLNNLDIDLAIIGEGEVPFLQLLTRSQDHLAYADIPGVVMKSNSGAIVKNPKAPVLPMDDLPILPLEDFYIEPYINHPLGRAINVQLSRGCPNACSFCDNSLFLKKIRRRSKGNMLQELQQVHNKYSFNCLYLDDLNPFMARGLIKDFCEVMQELENDVKWYGNGYAHSIKVEDLDLLVKGKCGGLHFGIESGSKDVLAAYNKKMDLARSRDMMRAIMDKGIEVKAHWIIGAPNETYATIKESIDFFVSAGIVPAYKILSPLPGTPMYEIAVQKGRIENFEAYLMRWKNWYDEKPCCNISPFCDEELISLAQDAITEIRSRVENLPPRWSGMWRRDQEIKDAAG